MVVLPGAEPGGATLVGHAGLVPPVHRVQLTAMSGDGFVEATLQSVGPEAVDVPAGQPRVVVMKRV